MTELSVSSANVSKTEVNVRVEVGVADTDRVRPVPTNEGRHWEVSLTPWSEIARGNEEALRLELLAVLSSILGEASLLPYEQFMARIEEAFERGLSHKIGFGPLLDELLSWTAHDKYEQLRPGIELRPSLQVAGYVASNHSELGWQDGPGPTYDKSKATKDIAVRYERVRELFAFTLERLRSSPDFNQTVRELRARGWLDWHILNCVASAATNYRIQMLGLNRYLRDKGPKGDEARTTFQMLTSEPETVALQDVPMSAFSAEQLEFNRILGLLVYVRGVGLDLHQRTPDFPAIDHFLRERYKYWTDDVAHDDPFT